MSQTYWVFPIEPSIGDSIRQVAVRLQSDDLSKTDLEHSRKELVDCLKTAIDAGFAFYYERPSEYSSLKPMVKRALRSIVDTIRHAIHKVVKHVFKSLSRRDLQRMANYLDSMVLPPDEPDKSALLAYPIGGDLSDKLHKAMESVRNGERVSDYDQELYGAFVSVVETSVRYYYREPISLVSLNPVAKKMADLGIDTTISGVKSILKRAIKELKHEEVAALPDNIHFLVAEREPGHPVATSEFIADK